MDKWTHTQTNPFKLEPKTKFKTTNVRYVVANWKLTKCVLSEINAWSREIRKWKYISVIVVGFQFRSSFGLSRVRHKRHAAYRWIRLEQSRECRESSLAILCFSTCIELFSGMTYKLPNEAHMVEWIVLKIWNVIRYQQIIQVESDTLTNSLLLSYCYSLFAYNYYYFIVKMSCGLFVLLKANFRFDIIIRSSRECGGEACSRTSKHQESTDNHDNETTTTMLLITSTNTKRKCLYLRIYKF